MFQAIILPIFRNTRLYVTACGIMHRRCCRPVNQESDCTPSSSYSVTNTYIFRQCSDSAWFCKIWDPCQDVTERSDTNRTWPH